MFSDPHLTTFVVVSVVEVCVTTLSMRSSRATCMRFIFSASRCDSQGTRELFYCKLWGFPQPNLKELHDIFHVFCGSDVMKPYNNRCQMTNVQRTYKLHTVGN